MAGEKETSAGSAELPMGRTAPRRGFGDELKLRVLSAVVLATLALALNYAGQWPFGVLVAVGGLLMAWEWGRLVRQSELDTGFWLHGATLLLAVGLVALDLAALALAGLLAGATVVLLVTFGRRAALSGLGVGYVGLPAVALMWLRGDEAYGFAAVLLLLAIVVASDSFAMIAGRAIGGPKLWPSLSPKKTWAGLIGATIAGGATCVLVAMALAVPVSYHHFLVGVLLGLVAQLGDLTESALKRAFGVKETGGLIPGHGGILDRMDSIVFAAPLAAVLAAGIDVEAPARALLMLR